MSASATTPVSASFSEDDVLRQIEQAVLDHRLPPGTKLKEVQLAELFGVKRGLIRKVLARLAHSRLVDQTPNRGATVAQPTVKEGQDLFAARRVLESSILQILAESIEQKSIRQLRKLLDREQRAYLDNNPEKALAVSVEFHRLLAKLAGNGVLEEYLNDVIHRSPLVVLTHLGKDHDNQCRNQEHEAIVDALENRDAKAAIKVMNHHLMHIESKIKHKPEAASEDLSVLLRYGKSAAFG